MLAFNDTHKYNGGINNEAIMANSNTETTNSNEYNINFYNRSDYGQILSELSPLRSPFTKAIPFLYYAGLITNAMCVLILTQKTMINRKSIFYLVILSFSDFMYNFLSELPNILVKLKVTDHDIFKTSGLYSFFFFHFMFS